MITESVLSFVVSAILLAEVDGDIVRPWSTGDIALIVGLRFIEVSTIIPRSRIVYRTSSGVIDWLSAEINRGLFTEASAFPDIDSIDGEKDSHLSAFASTSSVALGWSTVTVMFLVTAASISGDMDAWLTLILRMRSADK